MFLEWTVTWVLGAQLKNSLLTNAFAVVFINVNCPCQLWWTGDLSGVYPASHPMTTGIGSSPPQPWMDGWMSLSNKLIKWKNKTQCIQNRPVTERVLPWDDDLHELQMGTKVSVYYYAVIRPVVVHVTTEPPSYSALTQVPVQLQHHLT